MVLQVWWSITWWHFSFFAAYLHLHNAIKIPSFIMKNNIVLWISKQHLYWKTLYDREIYCHNIYNKEDIPICVDMRRASETLRRQKYSLSTFETFLTTKEIIFLKIRSIECLSSAWVTSGEMSYYNFHYGYVPFQTLMII